ncbi:MAG TPA: lysine--tRNA ligase [Tepidisphaeraceae bacterium]|jgi:lysyl-tRNA synthetase class 2|nr:lysine--tRNA ligase [Tepidisphaeraceae bacterium]
MTEPTSHYEQERRQKLAKLRELGIDPFGQRTAGIQPLNQIKSLYKPEMGHDGGPQVVGAGRVMLKRDMGKLSFLTLRDETGDLQIALDKKRLSEKDWQVRDLIDLSDLLVVTGKLGQTNKGETTIWADSVSMAAKALLPPPAKWEGLSDVELRYRQRYVDLWANPEVMRILKLRIRVVDETRRFLTAKGFVEVETPMMQTLAGGAAAKPFATHHNALDIPLYLRIAPELYLKRLLVGGFSKVFELNRNFRNEGISPRHNPEFTMLEIYEAFGSWETMADLIEEMITTIAQNVLGTLVIEHPNGRKISLQRPWRRVRMAELVHERTGWKFDKRRLQEANPQLLSNPELSTVRSKLEQISAAEQLFQVYEKLIEHTLIDPCFVTHIPSVTIPLARENSDDPFFADVYELAINGVEISPGYSELNDPDIQAKHFAHQVGDKDEQQKVDEDFLNALRYGMPPAGGLGMGVDRLVMMLTGAESIRDVILFPLMKPQEHK